MRDSPDPPAAAARYQIFAGALLLAALLLRLGGTLGDLSLDEIWSLRLAQTIPNPLHVFTALHHGNNHHLNTLLLRALGELDHEWLYRLPAALAGVAAVAVAGAIARRRGRRAALLAMLLVGSSYLLVHYSSEARGYSFAVLFALLSFAALRRYHERAGSSDTGWSDAAAFALCAALGFLSHLTFLHVYAGAGAWSLWRAARAPLSSWRKLLFLARPHAPVALVLAALWWVDLRRLFVGGDTPYSLPRVVRSTVALALGAPESGWLATSALAGGVAAFLVGLVVLHREGADEWVFFLVAILLSPACQLLLDPPRVLYERFFLLPVALLLLLVALSFDRLLAGRAAARLLALVMLGAILAGNAWLAAALLARGRGNYTAAIRFIAERSTADVITVGSDYDFRNGLVLDHYSRLMPPGRQLSYLPERQWPPGGPEWFLFHVFAEDEPPPAAFVAAGRRYRLAAVFPYARLSGWSWYLFRRQPADG